MTSFENKVVYNNKEARTKEERKKDVTTVYVDVVFFENLWMNAIILFATSLCLKKKVRKKRIVASAMLGAIYTLATCFKPIAGFWGMVSKTIVSIFMVAIAFRPTKKCEFVSSLLLFYLVSILFGGCALFVSMAFSQTQIKQGIWQLKASLPAILGSALIAYILWKTGVKILQKKEKQKQYELELWFRGRYLKCKAFLDTGNGLKDPITKEPVVILEEQSFCNLFNVPAHSLWEKMLASSKTDYPLQIIPYQAVGKKDGMLFAIRTDHLYLPELELSKDSMLIAMQEGVFCKRGEYQALIGPEILERSKKKDGFTTNSKRTS